MNSLMKKNHTLEKFFADSSDTFFGRTVEDILKANFFDSFDANIHDGPGSYNLEIAVPGMTRRDITIHVDDRVMWILGHTKKGNKSLRSVEFSSKHLQRSFALPSDADTNKIKAKCRNGLLTVEIAKTKTNGSHRLITIGGEESDTTTNNRITSWWTAVIDKECRLLTGKNS